MGRRVPEEPEEDVLDRVFARAAPAAPREASGHRHEPPAQRAEELVPREEVACAPAGEEADEVEIGR